MTEKIELTSKITKYSFYVGLISLLLSFIFIPFILITVISLFAFIVSFVVDAIKVHCKQDETEEPENELKSYFLGGDTLRKKDGEVQRGDCEIIFEDDIFKIKQNEEIIENDINSIYYFDIWDYQDDTYFKFRMRSGAEYKFCSQYFEADKIAKILATKGVKVEDNRRDDTDDE